MTEPHPSPAPAPERVTIALTLDDVAAFPHTAAAAAGFRDQAHRFEVANTDEPADMLLAADTYDSGSLLWCDGFAEALLLSKVHQALGHHVHVLWDTARAPDGRPLGHVVLTDRPLA